MGVPTPQSYRFTPAPERCCVSQPSADSLHCLDLSRTSQLHDRLRADFDARADEYAPLLRQGNEELHRRKITFGGARDMPSGLTALLLHDDDVARLDSAARMVHGLVEKTLEWLAARPERIAARFPHLGRMIPYLFPTRGWSGKQVVSRYDAVVTSAGELKVIELNTCCPAGFLHSETFCDVARQALGTLFPREGFESLRAGAINPEALVEGLLRIEKNAGIPLGMIAALTDENEISHELDLLLAAVRRKTSRPIEIVDARQLEFRDGELRYHGQAISLTYNKFRISVPTSQNHCWREGFEERYAAYLQAVAQGAVVSVNNFFGMAVGEDKGLLALWSDPNFMHELTPSERTFVERHVAWTRPLAWGEAHWRGLAVRFPDFLYENREQLVIKPAGEGRGYGVVIGKYASEETWRAACAVDPAVPCIVQEFVEPVHLPVVVCRSGEVMVEDMFLTVALATVCGEYQGILSRVSPNPVTNVARTGMVQAVLVEE